jgi:hypothetical protein
MTQHTAVFCLVSLSFCLLIFEPALASPLMSVHGDSAGRRQRMSTSWAPSGSNSIGEDIFNPMVRSKTFKVHDRVRPFNFRKLESEDLNPMTSAAISDTNAYFPLFRGGNNEVNFGFVKTYICFLKVSSIVFLKS